MDQKLAYVFDQLRRADRDQEERDLTEPTNRQRRLRDVVSGLLQGLLEVGSRTPLKDVPAWVTIEVAHGGFATGKLSAEETLSDHEKRTLESIEPSFHRAKEENQRESLNLYYASRRGQRELLELVRSGRASITVPEHAILPVMARLSELGRAEEAVAIWKAVHGFARRLRMFPLSRPVDRAAPLGEKRPVVLRTAASLASALRAKAPKPSVETLKEAVFVWAPFTDEVVALLMRADEVTDWLRASDRYADSDPGLGELTAACAQLDDAAVDWSHEARVLVSRYRKMLDGHPHCGKARRPGESLPKLIQRLEQAGAAGMDARLGSDCARLILLWSVKHGLPGGPRHRRQRKEQQAPCRNSSFANRAHAVAARLAQAPSGAGVRNLESVLARMGRDETAKFNVHLGEEVPWVVQRAVRQCVEAPLDTHLAEGRVSSAEVLSAHLPEVVAVEFAAPVEDEVLRELARSTYVAFRRRRSLLLRNLEHQVRLEELPWITPMLQDGAGEERAAAPLARAACMALDGFPGTTFPNPLISEFTALHPDPKAPWVEEIAADIFMGQFSAKWVRAGRLASETFAGTLYARYYGIPYGKLSALEPSRDDGRSGFLEVCMELAGEDELGASTASNGKVIEQAIIIAAGNLGLVVRAAAEHGSLPVDSAGRLSAWALGAFSAAIRTQGVVSTVRRERLLAQRRAASAWRQMVAFIALLDRDGQKSLLSSTREALGRLPANAQRAHWSRVHDGLTEAFLGDGKHVARPFVGWE